MKPLPIPSELLLCMFHWVITTLCLFLSIHYVMSHDNSLLQKKHTPIFAVILCFILMYVMGVRGTGGTVFVDSGTYRFSYETLVTDKYKTLDLNQEWFFDMMSTWCKKMHFNYVEFFLVIEIGYISFMLIANWKLLWENVWLAMLFAFSAFSFFSYGVNGLRHGLACSMVMSAIAFVATSKKYGMYVAVVLCFLALGVHRSTMLPIMCLLAAATVIKNTKTALYFWIASIPLSFIVGGFVTDYFSSWDFDDRMAEYTKEAVKGQGFSHVGFRWDFLLYSAMPVWLISYIVFQRNIKDRAFHIISSVYLLSNAFWVMVCRSSFSNRFAYLSWFIYPLVIAYPIIRLKIWKDQDMRAGWILLAHAGFSMFMYLIGK